MSHKERAQIENPANGPSTPFFRNVGIARGMRVLDMGCGAGDLSRLVARLAGRRGRVVGVDRSESALAQGRSVAKQPEAAPIEYRAVDLVDKPANLGSFDAIVGRRVLMYLPDAAKTLERLAKLTNSGAIVAFQEHGRAQLPAAAVDLPSHRQLYDWVWDTVAAEGGDVTLAYRLAKLMGAVGFSVTWERSEAILLKQEDPSFLPTLARAMLPRLLECGVASAEEVDVDAVAQRIEKERAAAGGSIAWDLAFLVSGRKE